LNDIQGSNSKRGLINRNEISEYKPFYTEREKFDILYNNNDNSSKIINGGQNSSFFCNINKKLKEDMNNNGNSISIENRNKLPYQYRFNKTNKKSNISNISNDIIYSYFEQRLKTKNKTDLFNIGKNDINFGLKSQKKYKEKYGTNNSFGSKNDTKNFLISPKIILDNSLEVIKDLNKYNLTINTVWKHIYFLKGNKY
jgi:hypothetical protein